MLAVQDVGAHAVQARQGVGQVLVAHTGAQQDVARVDAVAAFLDELDDMVAIVGLDDVAHALVVIQVKRCRSILRQQHRAALETRLAAIHGSGLVLTV